MEPRSVKIILLGDTGVGKTSLVKFLVYESIQSNVPPKLDPVTEDFNFIETEIIDTDSSSPPEIEQQLQSLSARDSAVVCIVCAAWWTESVESVKTRWIQFAREHAPLLPIMIIVNAKGEQQSGVLDEFESMSDQVELTTVCLGQDIESVRQCFTDAQQIALFPARKLMNADENKLKEDVMCALRHIFRLADKDEDGLLSKEELCQVQTNVFEEGESAKEIVEELYKLVQHAYSGGISSDHFNRSGFLYIWEKMFEKGRMETIWTILRHFGFDDELRLPQDREKPSTWHNNKERALTDAAIDFLTQLYCSEMRRCGAFAKGGLSASELTSLLEVLPTRLNIWSSDSGLDGYEQMRLKLPFTDLSTLAAATASVPGNNDDNKPMDKETSEKDELEQRLPLASWISLWHLMTLNNPYRVVQTLPYLGFGAKPLERKEEKKHPHVELNPLREVQQVFSPYFVVDLVGDPNSGRSHLIRGLLNYPFTMDLTARQQNLSYATVAISSAASVFRKTPVSPPTTPSKSTKSSQPTKKGPSSAKKPTAPTSSKKKEVASWLPKPDPAYQKAMSLEKGVFVVRKYDLVSYQGDDLRPADVIGLVVDLTSRNSLELVTAFAKSRRETRPELALHIIATKADLMEDPTLLDAVRTLSAELHLGEPTITSAKDGDYSNLQSNLHNAALHRRAVSWKPSGTVVVARTVYRSIVSHLPMIALAAGVIAGVWIGVSHSGYIMPYVKSALASIRGIRSLVTEYIFLPFYGMWSLSVSEQAKLMGPDATVAIMTRPAHETKSILPGSEQRLGTQHR